MEEHIVTLPSTSTNYHEKKTQSELKVINDHNYVVTDSPRRLKRQLDETIEEVIEMKKKFHAQKQKKYRLKKKVESLDSVIKHLKEQNKISSNCADILESTFSGVTMAVLSRGLKKKERKATQYSDEIKAFAMTLQFYSEKAYRYVRNAFDLLLPHPRHIRNWYSGVDGDPGGNSCLFCRIYRFQGILTYICQSEKQSKSLRLINIKNCTLHPGTGTARKSISIILSSY